MTHKDGHQSLPQMRNDRRIIKHFTFGFLPCNLLVSGRVAKWTILAGWPPQVDQGSSRETDGRHLSQRPPTQHVNVYGRSGAFAPNINPQMSSFPYLPRNLTYLYIQIGQTLLQIIFRLLPSSWFRQNSPTSIWTIVSLIRHQGLYEDGFCFWQSARRTSGRLHIPGEKEDHPHPVQLERRPWWTLRSWAGYHLIIDSLSLSLGYRERSRAACFFLLSRVVVRGLFLFPRHQVGQGSIQRRTKPSSSTV